MSEKTAEYDVTIRWEVNASGWKRGDTTRVTYDDYVRNLVRNGLVTVLHSYQPEEPNDAASKADWEKFLRAKGYTLHPQMTRRKMIAMYRGEETRAETNQEPAGGVAGEESTTGEGEGVEEPEAGNG